MVATLFDLVFIWRDVQGQSYLPRLSSGHLGVGKSSYAIINYEGYKQYKLAVALHPQSSWLWKHTASLTLEVVIRISSGCIVFLFTFYSLECMLSMELSIATLHFISSRALGEISPLWGSFKCHHVMECVTLIFTGIHIKWGSGTLIEK